MPTDAAALPDLVEDAGLDAVTGFDMVFDCGSTSAVDVFLAVPTLR